MRVPCFLAFGSYERHMECKEVWSDLTYATESFSRVCWRVCVSVSVLGCMRCSSERKHQIDVLSDGRLRNHGKIQSGASGRPPPADYFLFLSTFRIIPTHPIALQPHLCLATAGNPVCPTGPSTLFTFKFIFIRRKSGKNSVKRKKMLVNIMGCLFCSHCLRIWE